MAGHSHSMAWCLLKRRSLHTSEHRAGEPSVATQPSLGRHCKSCTAGRRVRRWLPGWPGLTASTEVALLRQVRRFLMFAWLALVSAGELGCTSRHDPVADRPKADSPGPVRCADFGPPELDACEAHPDC